jgi:hypothetical protein
MIKRVGEANGLVFNGFPTGVKTSYIIGQVTGKKAMLFPLNGLFEPFA